jgi:hypothetical protein
MKKTILFVLILVLGLATEVANADFTFGEPTNLGLIANSSTGDGSLSISADGMRVASDAQGVELPYSNGGMYFGTEKNLDATTFFSGMIDDIRIYNKALNAKEIEALAN